MSTGYGWEGLRQVWATLLGAHHVPERLCGGIVYLGALSTITRERWIPLDSESGGIPHLFGTSLSPHIGSA